MDSIDNLLKVKLAQLEVKWLKSASSCLHKEDPSEEEYVYKISCCYFIFSNAATNYKDVPDVITICAFYCHSIIQIIENITGEKIQELADQINRKEQSIPSNLLFWVDIIEKKKEEIYIEINNFIQSRIMHFVDVYGKK